MRESYYNFDCSVFI